MTARLDAELVRRGLARSRRHAGELLDAGRVQVDGRAVGKAARAVAPEAHLDVLADPDDADWASRAALKLVGALEALGAAAPAVAGRTCLDLGASTGGFTDVLLRRGAAHVTAVDVGHGQLLPRLREDPRVDAREGVNVRHLRPGDVPTPDLVVGDLSFISLTLVLGPVAALLHPSSDVLLLVKPQFEVGRERLGSGGVVRDAGAAAAAVHRVLVAAAGHGLATAGLVPSPVVGTHGNREHVAHLRPLPAAVPPDLAWVARRTGAVPA
ncbi:TlyA family RNA methyltransferase [Cellulomonas marina]|uniref:TlyA family RNA methyltransferase n=1 Tax=Cellulomonas marina TaxID=988821 RepID=UPI000B7FD1CB|nr:TlyA family RNA methyltransferase [Cellulomonas marina]